MLFLPDSYQLVQDLADKNRNLIVVMEADNRPELEGFQQKNGFEACEIYKEQGEQLYRLICERRVIEVMTGAGK